MADADNWLKTAILNFHCGRNYIYFTREKQTDNLLGIIGIISGEFADIDHLISAQTDHRFRGKVTT